MACGRQAHNDILWAALLFSNAEEYLAEAMREAVAMPQISTEEGCQAIRRIQELMVATANCIPAPRDVSTMGSQAP
jgi:hypothetical protein